jgi:trk system potassium uptake protein
MTHLRLRRPIRSRIVRLVHEADTGQLHHRMPIALVLVLGLAVLIGVGTLLLLLPGMTTAPIAPLDALFTATSAAAVTGLAVVTTSTLFTRAGQFVLLLLAQMGGMGTMVVVILLLRLLRRRISLRDRLTVTTSLGLDSPRSILRIVTNSVLVMLGIEALGALLLYLHWRVNAIVPPEDALFYAAFHAVMAFCNAGFDLFNGLPQYPQGIPGDPLSLLLLSLLIVAGGLGIPVYISLLAMRETKGRLSLHARITLSTTLMLIVFGAAGLLASEYRLEGIFVDLNLPERLLRAFFQSISARTAGFPGISTFGNINDESQLLLMALMFVGTGPASMGGGITTGTFAVLFLAVWSYAGGHQKIRVGERSLAPAMVWRAATVLVIGLSVIIVGTWLILFASDLPMGPVLFEVVSAFSTTGLSLGITDKLNVAGKIVIILVMFWGRLGAATIVLALVQRRPQASLVEYPEEQILIG